MPPSFVHLRWRALRAFSFPVSVLPVFAVALLRRAAGGGLVPVIACAAGVALLHAAGNLFNDYFDFRSGVDRRETDDLNRPGRLLVRGELRPRDVLLEAAVCLALASVPGLYLVWLRGPFVLAFFGAACAGLYSYTGPPLQLKHRALGEPLIFLVFGPLLMAGAAFALMGEVVPEALLLSVPVGFATTAVLAGNNLRDLEEDGAAGVRTLPAVLGAGVGRAVYAALVIGSALGVAALAVAGWLPLALAAAPMALLVAARPLRAVWRGERLPDIDVRTAQYETVLLLAVILGLAW